MICGDGAPSEYSAPATSPLFLAHLFPQLHFWNWKSSSRSFSWDWFPSQGPVVGHSVLMVPQHVFLLHLFCSWSPRVMTENCAVFQGSYCRVCVWHLECFSGVKAGKMGDIIKKTDISHFGHPKNQQK